MGTHHLQFPHFSFAFDVQRISEKYGNNTEKCCVRINLSSHRPILCKMVPFEENLSRVANILIMSTELTLFCSPSSLLSTEPCFISIALLIAELAYSVMLFIFQLTHTTSDGINNMAKEGNFFNNWLTDMEFGLIDGGEDDEHKRVRLMVISKIFVTQGDFFLWNHTIWQSIALCYFGIRSEWKIRKWQRKSWVGYQTSAHPTSNGVPKCEFSVFVSYYVHW